jgi:hypothetical protein
LDNVFECFDDRIVLSKMLVHRRVWVLYYFCLRISLSQKFDRIIIRLYQSYMSFCFKVLTRLWKVQNNVSHYRSFFNIFVTSWLSIFNVFRNMIKWASSQFFSVHKIIKFFQKIVQMSVYYVTLHRSFLADVDLYIFLTSYYHLVIDIDFLNGLILALVIDHIIVTHSLSFNE